MTFKQSPLILVFNHTFSITITLLLINFSFIISLFITSLYVYQSHLEHTTLPSHAVSKNTSAPTLVFCRAVLGSHCRSIGYRPEGNCTTLVVSLATRFHRRSCWSSLQHHNTLTLFIYLLFQCAAHGAGRLLRGLLDDPPC